MHTEDIRGTELKSVFIFKDNNQFQFVSNGDKVFGKKLNEKYKIISEKIIRFYSDKKEKEWDADFDSVFVDNKDLTFYGKGKRSKIKYRLKRITNKSLINMIDLYANIDNEKTSISTKYIKHELSKQDIGKIKESILVLEIEKKISEKPSLAKDPEYLYKIGEKKVACHQNHLICLI